MGQRQRKRIHRGREEYSGDESEDDEEENWGRGAGGGDRRNIGGSGAELGDGAGD